MKARILVVDDNLLNRKLAYHLLEMEGYAVDQCADAEEVLHYLAHHPAPDLILMDIALPGMDGLTLTRRLKGEARFANVPIVAMTAFAMKGDEERALAAGCGGYITKPIDTRQLPLQVAGFLDAAKAHKRAPLTVMVIEDHRLDLKLAEERVRLAGHIALNLGTAEEAMASLAVGRPDVVLLDLNLPGMDGVTFLRQLKADPQTRSLPVVALTAYPDQYQRGELLALGCAGYLIKPIESNELMRALELASAQTAA